MEDQPLVVFALRADGPLLADIQAALADMEYPAEVGVQIAGPASTDELYALDWEAAFVRWTEPERHEICLIVRHIPGDDEEADRALATARRRAAPQTDTGSGLLTNEALAHVQAVFAVQILPPLLDDEDHSGWSALDVILRTLAAHSGGIIYAEAEGFFDADGEPLLAE